MVDEDDVGGGVTGPVPGGGSLWLSLVVVVVLAGWLLVSLGFVLDVLLGALESVDDGSVESVALLVLSVVEPP